MRLTGGTDRGRKLRGPRGNGTRPTASRVRQAIFNILGPPPDAPVLDLYAGTGALGIEALSRGAPRAMFVERDARALANLGRNLRELGLDGRATIVSASVHVALARLDPTLEPFAWGPFPRPSLERWLAGQTFDLLEASHDGYMRLDSPVRHRRLVFFVKDRFWLIVDAAEGHGHHLLEIFCHGLSPSFELDDSHRALAWGGREGFAIVPAQSPDWSVELSHAWWSENYGSKEPSLALRCYAETSLPAEFATLLVPRVASRDALGVLERQCGDSADVRGYEYVTENERHLWVLAKTSEVWRLGEFSSDARVAYCARGTSGQIENIVLCEGSFFAVRDEKFLDAKRHCERIEYRRINGREEFFPSEAVRVCQHRQGNGAEMAPAAGDTRETPGRT